MSRWNRRMTRRLEPRESILSAGDSEADSLGDLVWYFHDGMISFARITEVRPFWYDCKKDGPPAFVMYSIRKCVSRGLSSDEVKRAHRSELFLVPAERDHLIEELDSLEDRARRYREELEAQEEDHEFDPERDDV